MKVSEIKSKCQKNYSIKFVNLERKRPPNFPRVQHNFFLMAAWTKTQSKILNNSVYLHYKQRKTANPQILDDRNVWHVGLKNDFYDELIMNKLELKPILFWSQGRHKERKKHFCNDF